MSASNHKSVRKILQVNNEVRTLGPNTVKVKSVIWCAVNELTSRTIKTDHVCVSVYVNGRKGYGIEMLVGRHVSIKIKNPMTSKCFEGQEFRIERRTQEATARAAQKYILNTPELSKNVTGVVKWFRHDGEGYIETALGTYPVFACNIQGAKTWYPETACMYLKAGETVTFDFADMGTYLTPSKVRGNVYFDSAKWKSLDKSRLAFKCDKNGKAINGLFA